MIRTLVTWMPLAVLCAACCFTGGGGGGSSGADPFAAPAPPAAPAGPAMEVSACAVQDAYAANDIAGQQEYPEGTHMIASGRVDNVGPTFGTMTIHPRPCPFAMVTSPLIRRRARQRCDPAISSAPTARWATT